MPIQSLGFLLALEPLAPDRGLLLSEGGEERDGLLDSLGLAGQAEEDLLEDALIEGLSELLVVRSAFLEAEEEVDLGAGGGHVGLDQEGLEANEVGDHVEDELGSKLVDGYLPLCWCSFSQNLESCRYLFAREDTSMLNFSPSFIYTLFSSSLYFMYLLSISATNY